MIALDDAIALVLEHARPLRVVSRPLNRILAHSLAEAILAPHHMPRFTSSAMDGYAVRFSDVEGATKTRPVTLRLAFQIPAGSTASQVLESGCAARIFTGASIPEGADTVLMQEHVHATGEGIIVTAPAVHGQHVRFKGEEFRTGDAVLPTGTVITPAVLGLLAALGYAHACVHARPSVTLIVTGDELIEPGRTLKPGQIYDSNSWALQGALRCMGIDACITHVPDNVEALHVAVTQALRTSDCVITSGGVSEGDHDHVRGVMRSVRVREHFRSVAMKPGKPVFFGTRGKKLVFGLPGNPVSALLALHLFVRPAIARLSCLPAPHVPLVKAQLGKALEKKPGRVEFVRVALSHDGDPEYRALPVAGQGSHMLGGMAAADGVIRFAADASFIAEGDTVHVERIQWSLS